MSKINISVEHLLVTTFCQTVIYIYIFFFEFTGFVFEPVITLSKLYGPTDSINNMMLPNNASSSKLQDVGLKFTSKPLNTKHPQSVVLVLCILDTDYMAPSVVEAV